MAKDTFQLNIMLDVTSPDYALSGSGVWDEHYHGNDQLKADVVAAVKELLENTLSIVMVNDVEMDITDTTVQLDAVEVTPEPHEQEALDKERKFEKSAWDTFHAEIVRREEMDTDTNWCGTYSMGNLSGPIEQLDEIAHQGMAMVAITDGWDDDGPVYSTSAILNPTNWSMFKMFCEALEKSNDRHHVFLEGLSGPVMLDNGVAVFKARTGS